MLSTLRPGKRHRSYRYNAPREDSRSRVPCDFRVSHATPTGAVPESWRNRCLRRRRRSWFCHGAWLKSAQCLSPSRSIAGLCEILHETQLVCKPLTSELHGIHSLRIKCNPSPPGRICSRGGGVTCSDRMRDRGHKGAFRGRFRFRRADNVSRFENTRRCADRADSRRNASARDRLGVRTCSRGHYSLSGEEKFSCAA